MTEAYPLQWPTGKPRTQRPQRSRFDTQMSYARDQLINELNLLGAKDVVLSTNIPLRNDGLPYARYSTPEDQGAAVYFIYDENQMCFACDRWDLVKDNIQAIRKTIEALRGIARWGTGDMMKAAFQGFEALPAPSSSKWHDILGVTPTARFEEIRRAFKDKYQAAESDQERIKLNAAYQRSKTHDH